MTCVSPLVRVRENSRRLDSEIIIDISMPLEEGICVIAVHLDDGPKCDSQSSSPSRQESGGRELELGGGANSRYNAYNKVDIMFSGQFCWLQLYFIIIPSE